MKKAYVFIKIEFQKAEDVIRTSGEYLETDKTPIGTSPVNRERFRLLTVNCDDPTYSTEYEL